MVPAIETIWRQALKTFGKNLSLTNSSFEENFALLKSLTDNITASDVKLEDSMLDIANKSDNPRKRKAPVSYIEIYEDNHVTIGIFVLKPGVKIPLHDHPQMHGILKVISGTVKIQSYNVISNELRTGTSKKKIFSQKILFAEKLPEVVVNEANGACILTPVDKNVHEIQSINGPAACLDILGPPYDSDNPDSDRSCHYFTEVSSKERRKNDVNVTELLQISSPSEYWSDTAPYKGPTLR